MNTDNEYNLHFLHFSFKLWAKVIEAFSCFAEKTIPSRLCLPHISEMFRLSLITLTEKFLRVYSCHIGIKWTTNWTSDLFQMLLHNTGKDLRNTQRLGNWELLFQRLVGSLFNSSELHQWKSYALVYLFSYFLWRICLFKLWF